MSKRRKQSNPQRGPPPLPLRPGQRPVSLRTLPKELKAYIARDLDLGSIRNLRLTGKDPHLRNIERAMARREGGVFF